MKALTYSAPWHITLTEVADPKPVASDDVVVEMKAVGICGTDLGIASGTYPAVRPPVVLGHEASGVVHEVGPAVTDLRPGDHVVLDPTFACGYCRMCTTARPNHCQHKDGTERGVSADGMFCRLHTTQRRFVHRVPDPCSFEAVALTEPLSCAMTGVQQLELRTDHQCAVLGGGPMGLLYSHALAAQGVLGNVIEPAEARREVAQKALPAGWQMWASLEQAQESLSYGTGFDIIVDTSGRGVNDALDRLARGGQLLVVGLSSDQISVDPVIFADHSKRIVGSIDSLNGSFAAACDLVTSGRLPTDSLVSHVFKLNEYQEAFRLLGVDLDHQRKTQPAAALKVVLTP